MSANIDAKKVVEGVFDGAHPVRSFAFNVDPGTHTVSFHKELPASTEVCWWRGSLKLRLDRQAWLAVIDVDYVSPPEGIVIVMPFTVWSF